VGDQNFSLFAPAFLVEPAAVRKQNGMSALAVEVGANLSAVFGMKRDKRS
jgi:hypothetical protein